MTTGYVLALCMSPQDGAQTTSETTESSENIIRHRDISCTERWHWDTQDVEAEGAALLCDDTKTAVTFHPHWSNGTAGIRATRPLAGEFNYWEIHVGDRVFGTSLMFGLTTKKARLMSKEFKNLIGEDIHGWGLSHKGHLYHNGISSYYCKPFKEYTPVVVGILVDRKRGEITYFKDGVNLGVAFKNVNQVQEDMYPTISSTAAKTYMSLGLRVRTFVDLQDRCRHIIAQSLGELAPASQGMISEDIADKVASLPLPARVKDFIRCGMHS
ncbi:SPRY domain-containing SOCS box protein 3 [Biomphalaria glabrata]|uniref:SPRY domain-containing SOCS box protein 3 n=1 Tax=Biomphalaria glabrata TaxID=6526 RepID=A0A2C9JHI0_BIOGL|nr:SPRY domain-containing SOCS box protein 3-like [Biomphalaria glabrata]XP_013079687.1 SPRY domain-containing SOCS box protein 3-like [Biomphalaria glabrata]XP_055886424.1 SPRY domain-containing SOCS box protein 3-like [Biomphalaria glabrata]KAI8750176.1 SPRY domain-containing SOCS box protein 3-like [Biomphalaria glabrata]KAI8787461.1 SPRY domain-containing SOCS box protein 3 [Biomphalaria glabrata]